MIQREIPQIHGTRQRQRNPGNNVTIFITG